jgi:hypothetical protein
MGAFTTAECMSQDCTTRSSSCGHHLLTDYHWLLLYDGLRVYCEFHNVYAPEARTQTLPVGLYQIGPIDFDAVVDQYFWDTDFLLEGPILAGLGPEGRQSMGVADEVFGIAQGLPPHPDELMFTPWAEPDWEESGEQDEAEGTWVPQYPPAE